VWFWEEGNFSCVVPFGVLTREIKWCGLFAGTDEARSFETRVGF